MTREDEVTEARRTTAFDREGCAYVLLTVFDACRIKDALAAAVAIAPTEGYENDVVVSADAIQCMTWSADFGFALGMISEALAVSLAKPIEDEKDEKNDKDDKAEGRP